MDEGGEGVGRLSVEQDVELDELRRPEAGHVVIKGSVALRDGLEFVIEIEDDLRQWHIVVELDAVCRDVVLADEGAALVKAEFHDGAEEISLGDDLRTDERLLDMVDEGGGGESRRIVDIQYLALGGIYLVRYVRHCGDHVHVELAEEALLHDLEVQEAEETAAEARAQRQR